MKRGCLWLVGILVVLGVLGAIFGGGSKQPSAGVVVTASSTAVPQNKPAMTKAEFDQIQSGMTYSQVTAIVGGPGEMVVETGTPGDPLYTVAYKFDGEGSTGANVQLMFQGGKMNTKAQFGLK